MFQFCFNVSVFSEIGSARARNEEMGKRGNKEMAQGWKWSSGSNCAIASVSFAKLLSDALLKLSTVNTGYSAISHLQSDPGDHFHPISSFPRFPISHFPFPRS
jgi:hypothetical protein